MPPKDEYGNFKPMEFSSVEGEPLTIKHLTEEEFWDAIERGKHHTKKNHIFWKNEGRRHRIHWDWSGRCWGEKILKKYRRERIAVEMLSDEDGIPCSMNIHPTYLVSVFRWSAFDRWYLSKTFYRDKTDALRAVEEAMK